MSLVIPLLKRILHAHYCDKTQYDRKIKMLVCKNNLPLKIVAFVWPFKAY